MVMVEINSHHFPAGDSLVQLLETDVAGVLPEALTAHVQVVLPAKRNYYILFLQVSKILKFSQPVVCLVQL